MLREELKKGLSSGLEFSTHFMSYRKFQYWARKTKVLHRALTVFFLSVLCSFCLRRSRRSNLPPVSEKISQMALFFHLYFLVGSGSRYRYDSNAFLFSLVNKPGRAPVKLPQTEKYSSRRKHSIDDYPSYGPAFGGGHDIHISNYASSHRNSYSNLGFTYSPPSGYSYGNTFGKTFLAGTYQFTPGEIETFYKTT